MEPKGYFEKIEECCWTPGSHRILCFKSPGRLWNVTSNNLSPGFYRITSCLVANSLTCLSGQVPCDISGSKEPLSPGFCKGALSLAASAPQGVGGNLQTVQICRSHSGLLNMQRGAWPAECAQTLRGLCTHAADRLTGGLRDP